MTFRKNLTMNGTTLPSLSAQIGLRNQKRRESEYQKGTSYSEPTPERVVQGVIVRRVVPDMSSLSISLHWKCVTARTKSNWSRKSVVWCSTSWRTILGCP